MILKCPYCGSTDIMEVEPEHGEKFMLLKVVDKGDNVMSKPVGGIKVQVYACRDCEMIMLHI